jgi:hypothetical protein
MQHIGVSKTSKKFTFLAIWLRAGFKKVTSRRVKYFGFLGGVLDSSRVDRLSPSIYVP